MNGFLSNETHQSSFALALILIQTSFQKLDGRGSVSSELTARILQYESTTPACIRVLVLDYKYSYTVLLYWSTSSTVVQVMQFRRKTRYRILCPINVPLSPQSVFLLWHGYMDSQVISLKT
jgi:hypothetical protein